MRHHSQHTLFLLWLTCLLTACIPSTDPTTPAATSLPTSTAAPSITPFPILPPSALSEAAPLPTPTPTPTLPPSPTPTLLDPFTLAGLRARSYPGGEITIHD